MDEATREKFRRAWLSHPKIPLKKIARDLGVSFHVLAKLRLEMRLPKRYGDDWVEYPTPAEIRLRCLEVQTAWSYETRLAAARGMRHD